MGGCCSKAPLPDIEVNTEAGGNTCCFDDQYECECPCQSTCCVIIKKERKKRHIPHKSPNLHSKNLKQNNSN